MTATQQDIAHGFHLLRDGDTWLAVGPEFLELQRSPAEFGDTKQGAIKELCAALRRVGYTDHTIPRLRDFTVHGE